MHAPRVWLQIAQIRPLDVTRRKDLEKEIVRLSHEGAIQVLKSFEPPDSPPFVAAVGKLQFEVLQYRPMEEYWIDTHLDLMPYRYGAYVIADPKALLSRNRLPPLKNPSDRIRSK